MCITYISNIYQNSFKKKYDRILVYRKRKFRMLGLY